MKKMYGFVLSSCSEVFLESEERLTGVTYEGLSINYQAYKDSFMAYAMCDGI